LTTRPSENSPRQLPRKLASCKQREDLRSSGTFSGRGVTSMFSGLEKRLSGLWSPSEGPPSPAASDGSAFMTQSPRESPRGTPAQPARSPTTPSSATGSRFLDIFSPVFTFFSGGSTKENEPEPETPPATAAPRLPEVRSPGAQASAPEPEGDEFDPYVFIRSLPPRAPTPSMPVCLPKKTRNAHPVRARAPVPPAPRSTERR
jgi:hypothetical protein